MSALPRGVAKERAVRDMFDRIAPRYDLLNRVLTFGLDIGWRRRSVAALGLARGSIVADLACGTGDFCRELSDGGLRPVGFDFAAQMLVNAKTTAPLVQGDVLALPLRSASVDGATCGFALRNVTNLDMLWSELARVVRPGGRIALLEVAEPERALTRAVHKVYFRRVVPLIGGLLSDRAAYAYLPRSTAYLPAPGALLKGIEDAGFGDVRRLVLGMGAAQLLTGTRL